MSYNFEISLKIVSQKDKFSNKNSNKGVKVGKRVTPITKSVKQKTKYDLKDYCQMRGLSLSSLYNGYISKKAAKILKKDGIEVT